MRQETLCWTCQRALPGHKCPWSDCGKPVDGWDAVEQTICQNINYENTYLVLRCPLFELDKRLQGKNCDDCIRRMSCRKSGPCADYTEAGIDQ